MRAMVHSHIAPCEPCDQIGTNIQLDTKLDQTKEIINFLNIWTNNSPVNTGRFNAKIQITDIDKLFVGQEASVRLSALDMDRTPDITGAVVRMSADVL
jgi:hypothetical protein